MSKPDFHPNSLYTEPIRHMKLLWQLWEMFNYETQGRIVSPSVDNARYWRMAFHGKDLVLEVSVLPNRLVYRAYELETLQEHQWCRSHLSPTPDEVMDLLPRLEEWR